MQLWELTSQLAEKLQAEVDLVDLRAASTVMQHHFVGDFSALKEQIIQYAFKE